MGGVISSPIFWNIFTLAVVAGSGWVLWWASKQPLWSDAFRRLRHNRLAMVALFVISVYVSIGLLDSIAWKDNRNADPRTVIDRLFERPRPRTYSAPFARQTTGEPHPHPVRETHALGTDATVMISLMALKGARTALLIAFLTTLLATPFAIMLGLPAGYFGKGVTTSFSGSTRPSTRSPASCC